MVSADNTRLVVTIPKRLLLELQNVCEFKFPHYSKSEYVIFALCRLLYTDCESLTYDKILEKYK